MGKFFNVLWVYFFDFCMFVYRFCVVILSGDGFLGERCNVNLYINIGFVCILFVNGFV